MESSTDTAKAVPVAKACNKKGMLNIFIKILEEFVIMIFFKNLYYICFDKIYTFKEFESLLLFYTCVT